MKVIYGTRTCQKSPIPQLWSAITDHAHSNKDILLVYKQHKFDLVCLLREREREIWK